MRYLLLFVDDADAATDLQVALEAIARPPFKPNPPGSRFGSPQERDSIEEADKFALALLHRAIGKIHFDGSGIVPEAS